MKIKNYFITLSLIIISSHLETSHQGPKKKFQQKNQALAAQTAATISPTIAPSATPAHAPESTLEIPELPTTTPAPATLDVSTPVVTVPAPTVASAEPAPKATAATTAQPPVTAEAPSWSAHELEAIAAVAHTAHVLSEETACEQDRLQDLCRLQTLGWDLSSLSEPVSSKPKPAPKHWLEIFKDIPMQWWQEHVTDKNRVEQFMRNFGIHKTYVILINKCDEKKFTEFIVDLNQQNCGEGFRWIDEALQQAVEDKIEHITCRLFTASISFKRELTPATRRIIGQFLLNQTERKIRIIINDCKEYARDISAIAELIKHAEQDNPELPYVDDETLEESAANAIKALTKCATAGFLPREINQRSKRN